MALMETALVAMGAAEGTAALSEDWHKWQLFT